MQWSYSEKELIAILINNKKESREMLLYLLKQQ